MSIPTANNIMYVYLVSQCTFHNEPQTLLLGLVLQNNIVAIPTANNNVMKYLLHLPLCMFT